MTQEQSLFATYQFVVYFFSYKAGKYLKVASIQSPLSEDVLDRVYAIMNGQPVPNGVRVRPFYPHRPIRNMIVGDVIECNGKAYYATEKGWAQTEYRKDHDYGRYQSAINDILHAGELAQAALPA